MGASLISTMLLGGVGWVVYHLLRAMRMREMAGLIQIVCWALVLVFLIQMVLGFITWLEGTALYRFIQRFDRPIEAPSGSGGGGVR